MWCLRKDLVNDFLGRIKSGEITPEKLNDMTSAERHKYFADFMGEDNAKQVNAQFEGKLLLKNQKEGMINWAKSISGMKPQAKRDIISRIEKMEKVLDPASKEAFLEDLASKRLGIDVTPEEAKEVLRLAKETSKAREEMNSKPGDFDARVNYGNKLLDFMDYREELKPQGNPFTFTNIINLPKSALTSILHFSAPGVQGWGMMTTKNFWVAFANQFKYFASAKAYRDLDASIISHPDYKIAKDAKLGLTHLGDKLSTREEAMQSSLLEHVPGLKIIVKASSRAFTGMLNDMRFGRFIDLLNSARLRGEEITPEVARDLARTVNDFTGRGAIGKDDMYGNAAPVLNNIFFSPRKISAMVQMLNPVRYLNPETSPTARLGALRQLIGSMMATSAILTLAKTSGLSVNLNPTANDFLKIKMGKTTIDVSGGNEIYARLWARIITNKKTDSKGRTYELGKRWGSPTRADLVAQYFRGKLSPSASILADFLYGKDPAGNPFTITKEMQDKLMPIVMQDFYNLVKGDFHNAQAWMLSPLAIFGFNMQTQEPREKEGKRFSILGVNL